MSTEVTRSLYINYDNAPTYFTANGVSLQINIAGNKVAIRHYMNGAKHGYATINSAGMDVLFPSDTAIPNKLDVASYIGQMVSSKSNWVEFRIDGTALERFPGSTKEFTRTYDNATVKSFRKNGTFMSYHNAPNTVNGTSVRYLNLTLYFTQYNCSANAVGNGIASASVDKSECYNGDTVTFTPKLVNGATWYGWYSDAECTNLVSTSQSYSVSPSSDITLYAKATIAATVYRCSAVAGENIASASVSDESVVSGDSVTFTAVLSEHCTFDGWFSDSSCTSLVSTANPYTAVITSDTTLYAKATKISYSISVGTAEHGVASVSANTAHYGDSVTFTFTPEDETWELYGWYGDEGLTQLVSESNPYAHSVTGNVALYPKVGKIRYKITFKTARIATTIDMKVAVLDFNALTRTERNYLKVGNYEAIEQSKVFDVKSASIDSLIGRILTVEILCPLGMTAAFWGTDTAASNNKTSICFIDDANNNALTSWPYYWYQPSGDATFKLNEWGTRCNCTAIAKEGIDYTDVTTPVRQGSNAIFEAEVTSGYTFSGWYSDEACTMLASTDNPAYVKAPEYTTEIESATSLTLYAKATKISSGTGIYIKRNGSYVEALSVYKKINGVWQQQDDPKSLFLELSSNEYNYVYSEN